MHSALASHLAAQGLLILDGGLATELERRGHDLGDDGLWSARLLRDAPEAIAEVHHAYLEAGADCIISAGYQATLQGFQARGLTQAEAVGLLRRSVELAIEARDAFWADPANRVGRLRPLVAAGIGPYGAYLADGSEYSGDYGISAAALADFHRPRWRLLAASGADLLACETVPCAREAQALAALLAETPGCHAWLSFSCRDGRHLRDGTPLASAVAPLAALPRVAALGVNCTAPRHVEDLLGELRRVTDKPLLAYPNSGEAWDAQARRWQGPNRVAEFAAGARRWRQAGAVLIGGCCRTDPAHIRALREILQPQGPHGSA
jgi:homocysteine S-methyltransferase